MKIAFNNRGIIAKNRRYFLLNLSFLFYRQVKPFTKKLLANSRVCLIESIL